MRHMCLMTKIKLTSREAILEAAFQVFNKNPGASLAHIAQHAGVGRATLHRQFKSRELLMIALAHTAIGELRNAIDLALVDATSHGDALKCSIVAIIPFAQRQWFLAHEHTQQDPTIIREYEADRKELRDSIDAAKDEGVFDHDIPTLWIAETYDSLIYAAWTMVREGRATPHQAADLAWRTLTQGLGISK